MFVARRGTSSCSCPCVRRSDVGWCGAQPAGRAVRWAGSPCWQPTVRPGPRRGPRRWTGGLRPRRWSPHRRRYKCCISKSHAVFPSCASLRDFFFNSIEWLHFLSVYFPARVIVKAKTLKDRILASPVLLWHCFYTSSGKYRLIKWTLKLWHKLWNSERSSGISEWILPSVRSTCCYSIKLFHRFQTT